MERREVAPAGAGLRPAGFGFAVAATDGAARAGTLSTPHAVIETPVFMPVGTQGTLKAIDHRRLPDLGARLVLANTYHLYLRPGAETLAAAGGLHRFMNLDAALLTDSGGFQVFSLAKLMKIRDEGVAFASHLDGSRHFFTPELVIDINRAIRPDIMMVLDQCSPWPITERAAADAVRRTTLWAKRAADYILTLKDRTETVDTAAGDEQETTIGVPRNRPPQESAPFGIVQGSVFPALRKRSVEEICALDFPGYAIGGLSVGEPPELMHETLAATAPLLPADKPRYFMGLGTVPEILAAVALGVDMFDCVQPTRLGRHGTFLLPNRRLNLRNAKFAREFRPPMEGCGCPCCSRHTLAYLHHLIRAGEMLGSTLASMHNVSLLTRIMRGARRAILAGTFSTYRKRILEDGECDPE